MHWKHLINVHKQTLLHKFCKSVLVIADLFTKLDIQQIVNHVFNVFVFFPFSEHHDQRLRELRQLQKDLHEDDWRYQSVDKLIGEH